jgi:hypothetical protein
MIFSEFGTKQSRSGYSAKKEYYEASEQIQIRTKATSLPIGLCVTVQDFGWSIGRIAAKLFIGNYNSTLSTCYSARKVRNFAPLTVA